ncbi:hypothetical protein GCM10009677_35240 [Sphaerisporangium rubeum]|uniref:Streptogrisin C n=1 Tax=Sphaerisporangium rubeum TaxID=321317 RepID=A0A7X0MAM2_9ACTN|nr:hypothetical protein [Sphaerisporangium rubeum]MBB6476239.1 hypothetical protein [Sphaerisporangium rubeum]
MNNPPSTLKSRRFRHLAVSMGIAIAVAGVGTAQAATAPDPVKPSTTGAVEHTGAVPGGFASWKDLLLFQQKLTTAADRITAAAKNGGGYAGIIAAPENRELRVYWKGKPSKAINDLVGQLRRDVSISVLPAQYSARELEREADRLIRANSATLTSTAPLQDGSGLKASTAVLGAARSAIAGASVPVTLEYGAKPELASRWDDSPPWWGGGAWRNTSTGGGCSTGFAVTYGGVQKMLSAGHCGDVGQTATDPTGQTIGSITQDNNGRDVLLIGTSAAGRVFNNPVGSVATEFSNPVIGTIGSTVGMFICTSGAYSGTNCNIKVTAVGVNINVGYIISGTVQAEQQAHTNAVGQGDSGGSVEVVNPSNTLQVYAAGVNTAIDTSTAVACTGYVTSGRTCAWRMYYSPWSNATTAFPGIAIITG